MPSISAAVLPSPPRAPAIKYSTPLGTRYANETAAAGGVNAFDLPTDPKNIGPWILGECVGKGASGRVKIAKHRHTGQLAAVKILPIAPLVSSRASLATQQAKSDKQRLGIDREITMMKLMNHPNIIRIYDVFESDKDLFLVLEYVEGGELFDFLVNRGRFYPSEALAYFKQIVYGLNYAHTFSIIHRDLKPENILIATISPPLIKIADWGMAAFAPPSLQLETSCGSPHYASPEIVNGQKYQGNATDIWSCGVILYALLTGRLPFDDENVKVLLSKVKSGKYDMPSWIDPLAKDLVSRMLVVDVSKRITVPEIMDHPWFCSPSDPSSFECVATELAIAQLPPSPSTLARPIPSPSLIDPELFASLRVIWGRHTDPGGESIRRDLCSPAGQGVHAKAFYFLLGKYREEARKQYGDDSDSEADSLKAILERFPLKDSRTFESKKGRVILMESPYHSSGPAPVPAAALPSMRRSTASKSSASRDRTASPIGPRPPRCDPLRRHAMEIWRAQSDALDEKMAVKSPKVTTTSSIAHRGPRPPPTKRGYTYSHPNQDISTIVFAEATPTTAGWDHGRRKSTMGIPRTPRLGQQGINVFPPSPGPSFEGEQTPKAHIVNPLPLPSPKADITPLLPPSEHRRGTNMHTDLNRQPLARDQQVLSSTFVIRGIQEKGGGLAATAMPATPYNSVISNMQSGSALRLGEHGIAPGKRELAVSRPRVSEDKENQSLDDNWSYVNAGETKIRGTGLGKGRDVGRNMGNIIALRDASGGVKSKKDKTRPPTLDFRNISNQHKRTSVLGSVTSPVNIPSTSNRILTSPAVGEFRGWFANLFNWRQPASSSNSQGGVLYSAESISQTCSEMIRILENLGIVVEGGEFALGTTFPDCPGTLKCRVDEANGGKGTWTSANNLKSVRLRFDFSVVPKSHVGDDSAISGPAPQQQHHHQQSYLSPPVQNHQGFLSSPSPTTASGISGSAGSAPPKKVRSSVLMLSSRRSSATMTSNPNVDTGTAGSSGEFPPGAECAITMVYEKGSVSSFRTIWKKVKEVYGLGACQPAPVS